MSTQKYYSQSELDEIVTQERAKWDASIEKLMKILKQFPPNIDEIRAYLTPPETAIYCYGDTIYAPNAEELYPDLIEHEKVHERQQKDFASPQLWWIKYLQNKEFRKDMEVEAYRAQYKWLKEQKIPLEEGKYTMLSAKTLKSALEEMAEALSTWYNIDVSRFQAETLIRHHG